jgi:dephospho-CoA kinase
MLIGITGKSGSGKSTIANLISKLNNKIKVVNIDEIGHDVIAYSDVKEQLVEAFGSGVINNNGKVDRKKIGELVFNNRKKMDKLTDITWHYMEQAIDNIIKQNDMVILDWILIPQTKYFKMCNLKILVDAPYEIRKEKAVTRDKIDAPKFDEREKASIE